jgi:hypothetical protein
MIGYASREYALSFGEAEMFTLPASGGHLLLRRVAGSSARDASGCYPLFACRWRELAHDLESLPAGLVSLALVTDPFCPLSESELRRIFEVVRPLGEHYIIELDRPCSAIPGRSTVPSRHHRRKLRRAPSDIAIEIAGHPAALIGEWLTLYDTLLRKHRIRGRRRFSERIFAAQLEVPGAVLFTARRGGRLIGADWYFEDGERVFAHLSAYSQEGYDCSVSYPMLAAAIEHFKTRAGALDLGGTPSLSRSEGSGLAAFKAGWSTRTLPSYLCGIALRPDEYCRLSGGRAPSDRDFFPYYRRDEY